MCRLLIQQRIAVVFSTHLNCSAFGPWSSPRLAPRPLQKPISFLNTLLFFVITEYARLIYLVSPLARSWNPSLPPVGLWLTDL